MKYPRIEFVYGPELCAECDSVIFHPCPICKMLACCPQCQHGLRDTEPWEDEPTVAEDFRSPRWVKNNDPDSIPEEGE